MDSITEKFSVFDFFNLMIGGALFWLGLGICNPLQVIELVTTIANFVGDSDFILFVAIALFIGCSLIAGIIINEIAHWLFDSKLQLERKLIENCLNRNQLIKNDVKLQIFRKKANIYLNVSNYDITDIFTSDQCSTYFAYCIYYLHVHGQDKKTEKLRETQGLSELLTLVFAAIPITSFIIQILSDTNSLSVNQTISLYTLFGWFTFVLFRRSKRAMENRLKMVLAVYDACVDMNDCTEHSVKQLTKKKKDKKHLY